MILAGGKALFLKRGPGGDYPGFWGFPGGRLEDGEAAIAAAIRETREEAGVSLEEKKLEPWARRVAPRETTGAVPTPVAPGQAVEPGPVDDVDFTTFIARAEEEFVPVLGPKDSPEHVAWAWAPPYEPPEPLHPGCRIALAKLTLDELGIARAIRDGELTSPQRYKNVSLFALRISGTGVSYRSDKKDDDGKIIREAEFVYRRPENYLTEEFLARCNGLPVIMFHPEKGLLNSEEFENRVVGTIVLPYLKGDEVWGIAKIYDDRAVEALTNGPMSTSPGVLLSGTGDQRITMEDGSPLLIEGKPALVDHLAICQVGVWDKGGEPSGVLATAIGDSSMPETKDDDSKKILDAIAGIAKKVDDACTRLDAIEESNKAEDARRKADAEAKEKAEADSRRKADDDAARSKFSARKDDDDDASYKSRHDAEEKEVASEFEKKGEAKEMAADRAKKARKDAEEEDEKKREEKAKADAKNKADAEKEEEEERKKADAAAMRLIGVTADQVKAVLAKMGELDARIPKATTEADYQAVIDLQARYDAICGQFGDQAARPLAGESAAAYDLRMARGLQKHSARWKDIDLSGLKPDAFAIAADQIRTDALSAAANPTGVPDGRLVPISKRLATGHMVTEFRGAPDAWMRNFAGATKRNVRRFNTSGSAA